MTDENKDTPSEAAPVAIPRPGTAPELVIEKLPFDADGAPRYKWSVTHDGRLMAQGSGVFSDNYAAAQDAANIALHILNGLSSSYCRLASEVDKARVQAEEAKARTDEAWAHHKAKSKPNPGDTMTVGMSDGSTIEVEV